MASIFSDMDSVYQAFEGVLNWEFGGNASYERLCEWAFKYGNVEDHLEEGDNDFDDTWKDNILRDYLKSEGETPSEYGL